MKQTDSHDVAETNQNRICQGKKKKKKPLNQSKI